MDKVSAYIDKKSNWKKELKLLRKTLLETNLEETIKWGAPTYVHKTKNIVGLAAFKNYCGLWFFQGGTLKDTHNVLLNAQEGKTKAMLQWRFYSVDDIDVDVIKAYVKEAIENEEKGNVIKPKRNTKPLEIHPLLQKELETNLKFAAQFEQFSLSKKREYANHISEAKREATQLKRLEKIIPMVISGVGLHDKYKNC